MNTAATPNPNFTDNATRARIAAVIARLKADFGDRVSTGTAVREQHGHGEAFDRVLAPDAVVWPQSTDEVSRIVALCHENRVPVIPFGAGTSLEGHVGAAFGGITVDLSRMDRILEVHTEDFDYKGHTHHASEDDPQYEIKSDKTDHVAAHRGSALERTR